MIQSMIFKLKKITQKGLFHILGASIINKIILFMNNIIIVRLISKSEFGGYSYALNILSILLIFNGLGVTAGILQYCSRNIKPSDKEKLYKYSFNIGISFSFILSLIILIVGWGVPMPVEYSNDILILLCGIPVISFLLEFMLIKLRVDLKNKHFSYLTTLNTVLLFLFNIIGARWNGVRGVIILRYLAILIPVIISIVIDKKDIKRILNANTKKIDLKSKFIKFSVISSANNGISQLLYLVDVFFIGIIIRDSNIVAEYKTATLIPFNLTFIPLSLMTFIYPYFIEKREDIEWIKKKYITVTLILGLINGIICITLFVFAPIIVEITFGSTYKGATDLVRILSVGYFISGTFRIPIGNILAMLGEIKFNFILTTSMGLLNIIIDPLLILKFGSMGAAVNCLIIYVISSLIGGIYLYKILFINKKIITNY